MEDLRRWLPTTRKELEIRGWDGCDVILFSGDAYIDHPSFGTSVIGRVLEKMGLRVAIVPQPNWRDDLRDFKKLGRPRLFFGVSAGVMDSMVNRYTASKRLRSNDAYTADGRADMRPERATQVYSSILKNLYPDVPIIIGGIEASMRRFTHYDYWEDKLLPSLLYSSRADILVYGMGELPMQRLAEEFLKKGKLQEEDLMDIPQIGFLSSTDIPDSLHLHSHEDCLKNKFKQAENFKIIEQESNCLVGKRIIQPIEEKFMVVNPPFPPMNTEQIDNSFDLPYTRLPHPKYKGKSIPAFEMIKFSVNIHRGCFGGCAFCTISAHQGKHIVSRSEKSILQEVRKITQLPDFKGHITDLGGPSANMYKMGWKNEKVCENCKKPSCLFPQICPNLNVDYAPLLHLYHEVKKVDGVKKISIGSGLRYDLMLHKTGNNEKDKLSEQYIKELITEHISGRLKVAPEHTSQRVLNAMRKPSFECFERFNTIFTKINKEYHLHQQLIPYFISSHPACTFADMKELSCKVRHLHFHLEQVQDFTPTPMTLSTEMFYTGIDPYTMKPIFCAKSKEEKNKQRELLNHPDSLYRK
ncbi:MAG TPA: YgiQ family radical SAM protein [Porphyromonadaceae bacterium]|nr:YgiQ family radical SAM protein [Porphyromonadaceae bacterium]